MMLVLLLKVVKCRENLHAQALMHQGTDLSEPQGMYSLLQVPIGVFIFFSRLPSAGGWSKYVETSSESEWREK